MFLSEHGQVYTCGTNGQGQLGHGDTGDQPTPKLVELLDCLGSIVQIAAGPSYALAVSNDGTLYSFGSGTNFCLGHGEQQNEVLPRAVQSFRRNGIHVVKVSAGDEHVVALDSSGYVSSQTPRPKKTTFSEELMINLLFELTFYALLLVMKGIFMG